MKKTIVIIFQMIILLFVAVIVGGVATTIVYLIPTENMRSNVKNSIVSYTMNPIEAWNKDYPEYTEIDMQTESIKIMEAISDEEGSAFSRAMYSVYYNYEGCTQMESLVRYINGEENSIAINYARYWHGYIVYLKPLLYFFSLSTIKMLNMTLQFVLCVMMVLLLRDKVGIFFSFAFCGLVLVLNPVTIFLSMQNDIVFYIASIFSLFILLFNDKMKKRRDIYVFYFMIIGIVVAFLDFLTYPMVSVGVPLIIYILVNNGDIKKYFIDIAKLTASWMFGYGGMWAGKWILSDLLLGTNVVKDGIVNTIYRSSGNPYGETAETNTSFVYTLVKNSKVLNLFSLKAFFCIMLLISVVLFIKKSEMFDIHKFFAVLVVSLYPLGWYFVVRNHSVIHPWIEYRELSLCVFGMACCLGILINGIRIIDDDRCVEI